MQERARGSPRARARREAAEAYRSETGNVWRPRRDSHVSQTGRLTSASIDARDFVRARKDRRTEAHLPQGTLVAIAGGKDIADPGVERIAAQWADRNGVHQIVCKPDWQRHGRAVPFRRNDELLNTLPKGVIAFPGPVTILRFGAGPCIRQEEAAPVASPCAGCRRDPALTTVSMSAEILVISMQSVRKRYCIYRSSPSILPPVAGLR